MIALLADEDFSGRITRGLIRRVPDLNLLTVNAANLGGQSDRNVLSWAAANKRIVLTHDVNTMIDAALDRLRMGLPMPGVISVPQQIAIGTAIADLDLIVTCAKPHELEGQVLYLPL